MTHRKAKIRTTGFHRNSEHTERKLQEALGGLSRLPICDTTKAGLGSPDLPVSTSKELKLKACTTTLSFNPLIFQT